MASLPSGTVTFLFTDVEGSTKLLDELGDERYSELLARHHRLCREAWAEHGGVEVDTAGDAFFVAFARASDALAAAAAAQEALSAEPLRVRMGCTRPRARLPARRGRVPASQGPMDIATSSRPAPSAWL